MRSKRIAKTIVVKSERQGPVSFALGTAARIVNGAGKIVTAPLRPGQKVRVYYTGTGDTASGKNTFTWDGKDASGLQWPDGSYTISVTAQDASGQPVSENPSPGNLAGGITTLEEVLRVARA